MTAFTLYGSPLSGPVYKVALALSLLGKPYRFRVVNLPARQQKSPEHLARNRYGEVPALEVENGPTLVQSAAILEWLAEQTGEFLGEDRQTVREWLFWSADRLAIPVYRTRAITRGFLPADPAVGAYFRQAAETALTVLDSHLTGRSWLVGDSPSIADVDVYPVIALAPEGGFDLSRWPAVLAFKARLEALPGWRPQAELAPDHDRD